jgi:hypothetical protein
MFGSTAELHYFRRRKTVSGVSGEPIIVDPDSKYPIAKCIVF